MRPQWSIGEVARRTGVAPSALRYYEAMGLLPQPPRESTHRRYDATVLRQVAVIQLAQQAGFTIAEMQILLGGFAEGEPPSTRWRALAEAKLPQLEQVIQRAQAMQRVLATGLHCGCVRWEECPLVFDAVADGEGNTHP